MARTPLRHLALIFAKRCLETYAVSGRINQLILEQLHPHTWRPRLRAERAHNRCDIRS